LLYGLLNFGNGQMLYAYVCYIIHEPTTKQLPFIRSEPNNCRDNANIVDVFPVPGGP